MKYLILGAGPAGLSFANRLKQMGESDFLVLEQEDAAGGLCRSINVDGSPLDIGGGHFLDVRRPWVNKFIFNFMPEKEWDKYERNTCININGAFIDHPFEANIWQLKLEDQVEYLKSIAIAGCNMGEPKPNKFTEWIYWKLGNKIAKNYMIPYNQKMFSKELDQLGTYWLEKLPNVSFEETLLSCLTRKAYGSQPGHTQFYYPKKYGYGEVWKRMAESIDKNIEYNQVVRQLDYTKKMVITADGSEYYADFIISTIPWGEFDKFIGMPEKIRDSIRQLKYSSIQTEYFENNLDTKSQWIYYPDPQISYHRVLVRHNFCPNSKGYWTETNSERVNLHISNNNFKYMNKYAYPLNTIDKPEIMNQLLSWSQIHGVFGLGRWGEHQHYNSDVTVDRALKLVNKIFYDRAGISSE